MARPLRIKFEGAWYHVMSRGINRKKIFFNLNHKNAFLAYLEKTIKIYGIEIHAYCLMDNHYHLIVHTPRANISEAMKYINSSYARYLNLNLKKDGSLFKGRYKAILIGADDYLLALSRYIHKNPEAANIIQNASDYPWSSYQAYIGVTPIPNWLTTSKIKRRFGENDFSNRYKKFMNKLSDELDKFYNSNKISPVLGSNEFKELINNYIKLHSLSAEVVGVDRILSAPSIETIIENIANYFNIKKEEICKSLTGINNKARRIAIYICRELGGYPLSTIGEIMGISYKTISSTIYRVKSNKVDREEAEFIVQKIKKKY